MTLCRTCHKDEGRYEKTTVLTWREDSEAVICLHRKLHTESAKVGQRYGKDREIKANGGTIKTMLKGIYFYPQIFREVKRSERKDGQINGEAKKWRVGSRGA